MLSLLRVLATGLGAVMLVLMTRDLLDGSITYGIGDITETRVATKSLAEAISSWMAFGSLFSGLIILGVRPRLYVERRWIWKGLITAMLIGYVAARFLR